MKTETKNSKSETTTTQDQYRQLALDQFVVISDWHYFAILELMSLKNYKSDSAWMAKALGITRFEVEEALERLVRIGLATKNQKGKWKSSSSGYSTALTPDLTSTAQQTLQKQFLEKAIEALIQVPLELRDHTSVTMAIDRTKLPEAKRRIKSFRRSLGEFLTESTSTDEVYNLNIALFPLTKTKQRSTL